MTTPNDDFSPDERETVKKIKAAYIQDQGLPEDLAEARAMAEVRRLAGRSDGSFDAGQETVE